MYNRGQVLKASDRRFLAGRHYIVYYSDYDGIDFIGAMLTHDLREKNKLMSPDHFEEFDNGGVRNKFQYDNTYMVIAKLIKFASWGPYEDVGNLTDLGIKFVTDTIEHLCPEPWEVYLEAMR